MSEPDVVVNVDYVVDQRGIAAAEQSVKEGADKATSAARHLVANIEKAGSSTGRLATNVSKVQRDLTRAGREALSFQQAMDGVGAAVSSIDQGLRNLQSEITKSKTLQRQAIIDQRLTADRARQADIESARAANSRLNIEVQKAAQSQLISQRQAGQQRIQLTRAVLENIGRLEKGLGAVIAGTARTATGAAGRVFDSLTAKIRNTNRVFTEGTSTALSRREQLIRGSFSRQERLLSETVSRQSRTIQQLNRQVSGGVLGGVTGRGAGAGLGGVAGGVGIASLLTSGFQRFSDLERINKQFLALTGSLEDTELLLGQVKEFAKTTPFNLVGVADLAKGFLAIGTATEDVIPRVTAIADAVAFTGGGVDELNRIQRAIGQVVSAGRLQGDELNQLAENLPALNIRKILADQLTGGNVAQLVEMQEAGEITSDLFVTGLITGLQQDERLVGASQDLADTLGGRVANLEESFADFGASLIGSISDPLKIAVSGAQSTLQGLADFVKGEVGPALGVLRTFLGGVAKGFAAVVAAKGAIEVISLVGRVAALAATPFGALVVAAGLIGGTLSVLAKNFPQVGEALRGLADTVRRLVSGPFGRLKELFSGVLDFFVSDRSKVVAGIGEFGAEVNNRFIQAADATSGFQDFITNKLLPTLRTFVSFAQERVLPVLASFGRTIVGAFSTAKEVVVEFVSDALPRLQTLAGKVGDIGKSISEAVGGSRLVAAAGAGIAGFAVAGPIGGIVAAFASLADKIIPALKPVGERILEFFRGLFTKANLIDVGKGALQVVETIGFAIGSIVTNPKFVTALAAVAAAAVLVAARFVEGFGRAFIENIPGLASLIGKGFVELAKAAFDPKVIAIAIAGAFVLPRLLSSFRSFGQDGAGAFASGFASRLRSARGFTNGLFSGIGGLGGGGARASAKVFQGAFAELDDLQRRLRAFGSNSQVKLSPAGFAAARAEIAKITNGIDEATLRGILFRDTVSRGFTTVAARGSQVAGGFRQIGTAFSQAVQNAGVRVAAALAEFASAGTRQAPLFKRNGTVAGDQFAVSFRDRVKFGVGQIATGFKSGFAELGQIAKSQGAHLGAVLGSAISAGVGGFLGGKMEGAAGGSGLVSVISATLTGAAIGGAPTAAVGLGAALIGTALGKAQKAAEDAEAAARTLADALKNDLADGLKAGKDGALDLKEALDDASDSALGTALKEQLLGFLPELVKLGVTQQDIIAAFREGGDAFDDLIAKVGGKQISSKSNGGFFDVDFNPFNDPNTTAIYENQAAVDAVTAAYVALKDAIELTNAETKFAGVNAPKLFSAVGLSVEEASGKFGPFVDGYRGLRDIVETEATPRFTESMGRALEDAKIKADAVSAAIDSIFGNRDPQGLAASFDAAVVSVAGQFTDLKVGGGIIDQAALDIALEDLKAKLSGVTEAGINEGVIFDEQTLTAATLGILAAALDGVEDQALVDAITAAYEDGVANAVPLLDTVNIYDQLAAGLAEPLVVDTELSDSGLKADAARLSALARSYGEDIGGDLGRGVAAGIDLTKLIIRKSAEGAVTSAANAMRGIAEIQSPSKVTRRIGGFMAEGLALGIAEGSAMASEAANQLTFAALNGFGALKSSGYSFGRDIGQAIVDGLADTEADMTSVVSDAVSAALASIGTLGDPLRNATSSAASQLFGGVTGSDRTVPGGKGGDVAGTQANITQGLQGFLSTFDSNVSQIFEVNAKKLKDLSATEREIFGTDVFSLDVSTVFGASNVTALTSSLDSIAAFGEAIIAQGVPLDQVSAKLQMYIDDLVTTATNLGFNQDQLLDLVATLGLSDAAIDDFINKVNDLTTTAASATPTPKPEDATYFRPVQNFIIQLPTGDPRAAALAVANSQAAAAELP